MGAQSARKIIPTLPFDSLTTFICLFLLSFSDSECGARNEGAEGFFTFPLFQFQIELRPYLYKHGARRRSMYIELVHFIYFLTFNFQVKANFKSFPISNLVCFFN